jgi:hypothetical protein
MIFESQFGMRLIWQKLLHSPVKKETLAAVATTRFLGHRVLPPEIRAVGPSTVVIQIAYAVIKTGDVAVLVVVPTVVGFVVRESIDKYIKSGDKSLRRNANLQSNSSFLAK